MRQTAIHSGFGPQTTAREVLKDRRLDGMLAIVTGGYTGVGLETTRAMAEAGATVIVPARSADKARAALAGVARVELDTLDLADPASIDAFASRVNASGRKVDVLINNAGIMAAPLSRDARGIESQLATNHVGHFQLAVRLRPALAAGARIVALSSRGHARSGMDFEDPSFLRRPYDKWVAYGQSKTANALFAIGVNARGIQAFSVHPGAVLNTDLGRFMDEGEQRAVVETASKVPGGFKTAEQGAATSVWCATSPQLAGMGGVYCEDCDVAEAVPADYPQPRGVRPWAMDPEAAERLWTLSEEWTGARW
jgi:NAD(P)-dependent dehydrogenase (short-subunit alcohol dehydrogenase family)